MQRKANNSCHKNMKRSFLLILLTAFAFSCNKEKHFTNNALIIGEDYRMCACCGGLKLTFSDSLNPVNFYLIANADILKLPPNRTFPIKIKLDCTFPPGCGGQKYVYISSYMIKW